MLRTRLHIAGLYESLSDNHFHSIIVKEYDRACESILKITGQSELLANRTKARSTIRLRNANTDVLNLIQIALLKRWKMVSEDEREDLRHALFLTINGIAAAMQSTG